jgi:hypothetical protein
MFSTTCRRSQLLLALHNAGIAFLNAVSH